MNSSMKMTFGFALAALTATPVIQSATAQEVAAKTAIGFGFLSAFKYCFTKPTEDADRYNTCELARGENLASNLYYLYVDGFLGHNEKEVGFEVTNSDTKTPIIKKKKIAARGIIGKLHANYLKPFMEVVMVVAAFRTVKKNMNEGFDAWNNFSFSELLTLKNPDTKAKAAVVANPA
jgi:hypothetical protein